MTRIEAFLTDRNVLLGALIVVVVCMLGFQELDSRLGYPILDSKGGYDFLFARERLADYGEAGRTLYARAALTLDLVFPLAVGVLFGGLLVRFAAWPVLRHLAWVVAALVALDLAENIQLVMLLTAFPDIDEMAVAAVSQTTSIKWMTAFLVFALVAAQFLVRLGQAAYRRFNS